jgi:hypothetical protein
VWVAVGRFGSPEIVQQARGTDRQMTRLDKSVLNLTHKVKSSSKFYVRVCTFLSLFISLYKYIYIYKQMCVYTHTHICLFILLLLSNVPRRRIGKCRLYSTYS